MDVNVAGLNINLRKDGLSNLLDKQSTVANAGLLDGIQKPPSTS